MNTYRILMGSIIITMAVFTLAFVLLGEFVLAMIAAGAGGFWFWLETRAEPVPVTPFFALYVGLALVGAWSHLPAPVMAFGLCMNLAAWDLSRFRGRMALMSKPEANTALEQNHLQRLVVICGAGFLLALIPLFVQISTSFVVFAVLTLLMMGLLRYSVVLLRRAEKPASEKI